MIYRTMKYLISFFVLYGSFFLSANGQESQSYVTDFDSVFSVFNEKIQPYLKRFAENNYKNADPILIEATYEKYKAKVDGIRIEYLKVFERNRNKIVYSKGYFHGVLDQAFQFEFPCLDVTYFNDVSKEVREMIKGDTR